MSWNVRSARTPRGADVRSRLRCETLEDRLTPAVTVKFDYTYDTAGMFNDPAKREALERAADAVTARMTDSLGAITPSGSNTWTAKVYDSASGKTLTFANPTINADEITVYITSGYLGGALGIASSPGFSAQGSSAWFNQIRTRGEAAGTDIGPWGGLIAFNTNYAFSSDGTPTSGEFDLQTVATHELLHVFGLGMEGASYTRYASGTSFTGPNTMALLGGSGAPLQSGGDHIAPGFGLNGKESILAPSIMRGQVKGMTELEYAMLSDIGWDQSTASVPPVVVPPVVVPPIVISPPPVVVPPVVPPVVISPPPVVVPPVVVPPVVPPIVISPPPVVVPPVVVPPVVPPVVISPPPVVVPPVIPPVVVPPVVPPVTVKTGRQFTIGSDAGNLPTYSAYDANGQLVAGGLAFSSTFRGGVRTATADVNGDGVNDSIVVAGVGSAPHVRAFDGKTGSMILNFLAFDSSYRLGASVAAGDVNGDGKADIAVGVPNGPTRIFSGANGQLLAQLTGLATNGLAMGDVNGDGFADVAVANASSVTLWNGKSIVGGNPQKLSADVAVVAPSSIAFSDIDGDGRADLIVGAGANTAPLTRVYSGSSILTNQPRLISEFQAADANFRAGVRLTAADMNNDGREDIIAVAAGAGSGTLKVFSGKTVATGTATPSAIRTMWNSEWAIAGIWVG